MNEWDDYWSQGHVSCFPDDPKLNQIFANTWSAAFKNNVGNNCSILDLACGGGYLTDLLITEYKNTDKRLQLSLSDICDIHVKSSSSNVVLQLYPKVNNELLPFKNNAFDFIISNFGFEYSQTEKTIDELARVLNNKGRFALNCHFIDSQIIKNSIDIVDALMFWLETNEMQKMTETLFTNDHSSQFDKRQQSKLLIDELASIDKKTNGGIAKSGLLEAILPLLKNNIQLLPTLDEYNTLKCNYKNYLKRIQAQINAALTKEKIIVIKERFLRNNIHLDEIKYLTLDDKVVSVYIQGSRNVC